MSAPGATTSAVFGGGASSALGVAVCDGLVSLAVFSSDVLGLVSALSYCNSRGFRFAVGWSSRAQLVWYRYCWFVVLQQSVFPRSDVGGVALVVFVVVSVLGFIPCHVPT